MELFGIALVGIVIVILLSFRHINVCSTIIIVQEFTWYAWGKGKISYEQRDYMLNKLKYWKIMWSFRHTNPEAWFTEVELKMIGL